MTSAIRLADGVLLVVDAAEGIMVVTERAVRQALQEGLTITLMISKVRARGMGWERAELFPETGAAEPKTQSEPGRGMH